MDFFTQDSRSQKPGLHKAVPRKKFFASKRQRNRVIFFIILGFVVLFVGVGAFQGWKSMFATQSTPTAVFIPTNTPTVIVSPTLQMTKEQASPSPTLTELPEITFTASPSPTSTVLPTITNTPLPTSTQRSADAMHWYEVPRVSGNNDFAYNGTCYSIRLDWYAWVDRVNGLYVADCRPDEQRIALESLNVIPRGMAVQVAGIRIPNVTWNGQAKRTLEPTALENHTRVCYIEEITTEMVGINERVVHTMHIIVVRETTTLQGGVSGYGCSDFKDQLVHTAVISFIQRSYNWIDRADFFYRVEIPLEYQGLWFGRRNPVWLGQ